MPSSCRPHAPLLAVRALLRAVACDAQLPVLVVSADPVRAAALVRAWLADVVPARHVVHEGEGGDAAPGIAERGHGPGVRDAGGPARGASSSPGADHAGERWAPVVVVRRRGARARRAVAVHVTLPASPPVGGAPGAAIFGP